MQTYLISVKQQILSMIDKHEKNQTYHLYMDLYNNSLEIIKTQFIDDKYKETIEELQKIFPNYNTTKNYPDANAILQNQVENYINFFEKYKDSEDSLFLTLVEVIKILLKYY